MKEEHPKPDICTSYMCSDVGCEYCKDCNHAVFKGEGCLDTGRCYRWEYEPWLGFTFRGPGISKNHQPGGRHPVWALVKSWAEQRGLGLSFE